MNRARKRQGRGSPDQPRDDHGRWTSEGGTSTQLTHTEGEDLRNVVDNAGFVDLGDKISSAMDDLQSQIDATEEATNAADEAEAAGDDATDENAAVTEEQQTLHDRALELHAHLQAMAKASAAALKNYEAQLAKAGVGSIQDGKRAARLAEVKALRASARL